MHPIGEFAPVHMRALFLAVGLSTALSMGCATTSAGYRHDEAVDFSKYQTYAWITEDPVLIGSGGNPKIRNPDNERMIRAEIDEALQQKGYRKVPIGDAQLVVTFAVGTRERLQIEGAQTSWGFFTGTESRPYYEGTLFVDILDCATRKQVWHGWAKKPLDPDDKPDEVIGDAVARIMSGFPPP